MLAIVEDHAQRETRRYAVLDGRVVAVIEQKRSRYIVRGMAEYKARLPFASVPSLAVARQTVAKMAER